MRMKDLKCEICGRKQKNFNVCWDKDRQPHLICGWCKKNTKKPKPSFLTNPVTKERNE